MHLQWIRIKDFGPYRRAHSIDIRDAKNNTAFAFFGEQNGRGKSTLYNAMRWCLFGEVIGRERTDGGVAIRESRRPIVGDDDDKYLMNTEHLMDDTDQEMAVMMMFQVDGKELQISRSAKSFTTLPRSDDDLTKKLEVNFDKKSYQDLNGQEIIESIFPRELERFFFIDGEALDEYSKLMDKSKVGGLRDEVRSVLGIPAVKRGANDIESILTEVNSKIKDIRGEEKQADKHQSKLSEKRSELTDLNKQKKIVSNEISNLETKINEIEENLRDNDELKNLIDEKRHLITRSELTHQTFERTSKEIKEQSKNAWKVMLWGKVKSLVKDTQKELDQIQNAIVKQKLLSEELEKRKKEYEEFVGICNSCGQELPDVETYKRQLKSGIESLNKKLKDLKLEGSLPRDELMARITRMNGFRADASLKEGLLSLNKRWISESQEFQKYVEKISILEERIENSDVDEEDIKSLNAKQIEIKSKISNLHGKHTKLVERISMANSEIGYLERNSKSRTISNSELKVKDILSKLSITLERTIESYLEKARKKVQQASSEVFDEVTNAPDVFNGIELDEHFRAKIKLVRGRNVITDSSGMKAMKTLSVLDGLRQVSGLKAPTFFDTPGRSLDKTHRELMLKYFWRDHGRQFFIFAHDGEFPIHDTIRDYGHLISKAWSLTWPTDWDYCPKCKSKEIVPTGKPSLKKCLSCEEIYDNSEPHTYISPLELES